MGREVKRVAKGFEWPIHKVWKGFLNPYYKYNKNCPFCNGGGLNPETTKIADEWYDHDNPTRSNAWHTSITQDEVQALIDGGRLMDFTHTFKSGSGWQKKNPPYVPTADEVNAWAKSRGMGHDSINRRICIDTRAKRLGVYGKCEFCKGSGELWLRPEYKEMSDNWKEEEPPVGEWYQMWETTSEGSPISPAFETPEELARWLTDNNSTTFGHQTTSYEKWLAFIRGPAWAPTMIMHNGVIESGVDAITTQKDARTGK